MILGVKTLLVQFLSNKRGKNYQHRPPFSIFFTGNSESLSLGDNDWSSATIFFRKFEIAMKLLLLLRRHSAWNKFRTFSLLKRCNNCSWFSVIYKLVPLCLVQGHQLRFSPCYAFLVFLGLRLASLHYTYVQTISVYTSLLLLSKYIEVNVISSSTSWFRILVIPFITLRRYFISLASIGASMLI